MKGFLKKKTKKNIKVFWHENWKRNPNSLRKICKSLCHYCLVVWRETPPAPVTAKVLYHHRINPN